MLDVLVDRSVIREAALLFGATAGQVERARASALRKMRRRIETAVKQRAAKQLRMPQKAIDGRFYSEQVKQGDRALKVWIGTYAVSPFKLGSVSSYGVPGKTGGVRAGRRTYRGAFLAKIYSGTRKVWIRLHSSHYSPELYPTKYRRGDRGLGDLGLRGRFPVVRAAVPIDEVLMQVVNEYGPDIVTDFERLFQQELNYQTNVRGRKAS